MANHSAPRLALLAEIHVGKGAAVGNGRVSETGTHDNRRAN